MNVLKRSVIEWINLLTRLNDIKKKYGSSIFQETILYIHYLEQGKFISVGVKAQVIDLLVEHGIDDFGLIKQFLEKSLFNIEKVVGDLKLVQEKYGLDMVALILEKNKKCFVPVNYSKDGYHRVYFPKDVIPMTVMDFETGKIQYIVSSDTEFILDKREGQNLERTFYTSDFRFARETFPSREQMDYYDDAKEKRNWMDQLIFHLSYFNHDNTQLVIEDPNHSYDLTSKDVYQHYTIFTDGIVMDSNGRKVENQSGYFKEVNVCHADVLMVCQMIQNEIVQIKLVVHPLYFKEYVEELKKEHERGLLATIYALLDHCKKEKGIAR